MNQQEMTEKTGGFVVTTDLMTKIKKQMSASHGNFRLMLPAEAIKDLPPAGGIVEFYEANDKEPVPIKTVFRAHWPANKPGMTWYSFKRTDA